MEAIRVPAAFPSPADVQGRRIVITGASRGLGRVIATGLARAGARVALVSRDRDALAALAAELPDGALVRAGDVTDPDFDEQVADDVVAELGGLDAWIANAGVSPMALDLGPRGITVNVVSPGWFESPLASGFMASEQLEAEILGHTALRRWGQGEDLLGAYLFLCSDASAFVTGTVVTVDGGYLCA